MRSDKVFLPVSEAAIIENSLNRLTDASPIKTPQGTILIIDDNFAIREALTDIISLLLKMTIYTAANGEEGLQIFQQQNIALVILDLKEINGQQTYDKMQQFAPQVKVIVSSRLSLAEARLRFGERELPTFLQKPYDLDTLLNVLQTELAKS